MTQLKRKGVLKKEQYDLIFPRSCQTDSKKFDMSILVILLSEICGFQRPEKNWTPEETDNSEMASFFRSRIARNKVQHLSTALSEQEYKDLVNKVKRPMLDLGCSQGEIDEILGMAIDNNLQAKTDLMERSHEKFSYRFLRPVANFIGRDKEIDQIHQHLNAINNSISDKYGVIVCGMAGVGKTETVQKYWMKYSNSYYDGRIIWINARNKDSIETDFISIAEQAGLTIIDPDKKVYKPINKIVYMTYGHFVMRTSEQAQRKELFVFDNVVNNEDLEQFLPPYNIKPYKIVTSQNKDWDYQRSDILPIEVLPNSIAHEFLVKNLDVSQITNDSSNTELISSLEYHPLAMQQAVAYMMMNDISVEGYVNLLKNEDWSSLADQSPNKSIGTESVFKTFTLAIRSLNSNEDALKNIFSRSFTRVTTKPLTIC